MKKMFLSFENANGISRRGFAPKIQSRRLALRSFENVAYREDGSSGEGEPDEATKKLMTGIQEKVKEELQKRSFTNSETVQGLITRALEGLPIEALRNFKPEEIQKTVNNLAGAFEKFQQNQQGIATAKRNAVVEMMRSEEVMNKVQAVFQAGEGNVTLNVRAAVAPMTTANTLPAEDIPEDILHSFSVEGFVKKRRPQEYIFNMASRRTVASVTKYKTWLEEGTEDGAFAIVAEGAVKPIMSKTLVRNTVQAKKVAGKRVYTEDFVKFKNEVYGILEDLFNDQIQRNYAALLTTDLIAKAAAYVGTTLDAQYETPTDYHAIGAVAAQIEALDFVPDLLIINPQDKWRIGLQQATDGHFFLNVPVVAPNGGVSMLGFSVVTTNRMTAGEFMLGESGLFKIEDEAITVRMGYGINVTKDVDGKVTDVTHDLDTNSFRIIAETWFIDWISTAHDGSFVKTTFADVKAALLKPAV